MPVGDRFYRQQERPPARSCILQKIISFLLSYGVGGESPPLLACYERKKRTGAIAPGLHVKRIEQSEGGGADRLSFFYISFLSLLRYYDTINEITIIRKK